MQTLVAAAPYASLVVRPLIVLLVLIGLAVGVKRLPLSAAARLATWLAIAVPLLAWWQVMAWIGRTGLYHATPQILPLANLGPAVLWLLVLTRFRRVAAILDNIPPSWLIAVHFLRGVALFFLVLWLAGIVSGPFAPTVGIGDLMIGTLALVGAVYVHRQARGWRTAGYVFNALGFGDYVLNGTVALLYGWPTSYPVNLTPTFGVGLFTVLHGLSVWQLKRSEDKPASVVAGSARFESASG